MISVFLIIVIKEGNRFNYAKFLYNSGKIIIHLSAALYSHLTVRIDIIMNIITEHSIFYILIVL